MPSEIAGGELCFKTGSTDSFIYKRTGYKVHYKSVVIDGICAVQLHVHLPAVECDFVSAYGIGPFLRKRTVFKGSVRSVGFEFGYNMIV